VADVNALAIRPDDAAACLQTLRRGSKSFALATRLLPHQLRTPVTALYAFCREADDAVDTAAEPARALGGLHARLDRIYTGVGLDYGVDRALAATVQEYALPRPLFDALLEGFAWDAAGRQYETLSDVIAYSARVASSVGVLMALLMGRREAWVLGRAAELGVAMQLTNMARDVGEDARLGRLYLPRSWWHQVDLAPEAWLAQPQPHRAVRGMVQRLLTCAEPLYHRADGALSALPFNCRVSIDAAARIYRDIGRSIARHQFESITRRAYVSLPRKIVLATAATVRQVARLLRPLEPQETPTLPEVQFLVAAVHPPSSGIAQSTGAARHG
jgi:phytoene synthase